MALTLIDLQTEISEHKDYKDLDQAGWEEKIEYRDITHRSQKDFDNLKPMYVEKLNTIREKLSGEWDFHVNISKDGKTLNSDAEILDAVKEKMDEWYFLNTKERRIYDKLAVVLKEEELRKDPDFLAARIDAGIHDQTDYYIDYDNGIDSAFGEKQGNFTADAGTNATTIVDAELNGLTITDNAASSGDYVYNVTRGAGGYVDAWDDGTDTITLVGGGIAGQTTGDTYYIISAWKTLPKYTSETVRLAGDRAFIRAGITWDCGTEAEDITFDEDGDENNYIYTIGCDSVTNDPWSDASDVKPILDFEDAAYQILLSATEFIRFERLNFQRSTDTAGLFRFDNYSHCSYIKDCDFSNNGSASGSGVYNSGYTLGYVDGCTFSNLGSAGIYGSEGSLTIVKNCTFTGGGDVGDNYAIYNAATIIYCWDCTISGTYDNNELYSHGAGGIFLRNVDKNGGDIAYSSVWGEPSIVQEEDYDDTFEAHRISQLYGTITRGTTNPRAGGADSFATMAPTDGIGVNRPLVLGNIMSGFAKVWATASVEITISVYAVDPDNWATQPGNSGGEGTLFLRASYLSNGASAARTEIDSDEDSVYTGTRADDWVAYQVTLTPARTGWVYLWMYLGAYESGKTIDVDIKPVVS